MTTQARADHVAARPYHECVLTTSSPALGTGRYRYELNGEDSPVDEHFEVSPIDTGRQVTSIREASDGHRLTVVAEFDRTGLMRAAISFETDGQPTVRARYSADGDHLSVSRSVDDEPAGEWEQSRTGGFVLSPLLRVFQGPAVAACVEHGDVVPVVVPDLTDPTDLDSLLSPLWHERQSSELGRDVMLVGDETVVVRRCSYEGGGDDDAAEFWITDDARLVRYRFRQDPDTLWEVRLADEPSG